MNGRFLFLVVALLAIGVSAAAQPSNGPASALEERYRRLLSDWASLNRFGSENTEVPPPAPGENRVVFIGDQTWGRRGVAIDSTGTAWTTTGDGIYDPTSTPPRYANSVIGAQIVGNELKLKDYYTPTNWEWLRKRDLDPNNTPTIDALDAQTGQMLWSSGEQIQMWNHFSGITVANGRVYLGTYDGTLYCFGVDAARSSAQP